MIAYKDNPKIISILNIFPRKEIWKHFVNDSHNMAVMMSANFYWTTLYNNLYDVVYQ